MSDVHPKLSLVVVVDDDDLLRFSAVELLEDAGFRTVAADSADAALHIMRARWREVRALFTDVQMPGDLNGVGLAEEVHRCWPDVLLLVTSGGVDLEDGDLPDDGKFLPKPYRGSTLIEQVRGLIAKGHTG